MLGVAALRTVHGCGVARGARHGAAAIAMPAIPGGSFESVLPPAPGVKKVAVASFRLDRTPVTNASSHGSCASTPNGAATASRRCSPTKDYLAQWTSATEPGAAINRPTRGSGQLVRRERLLRSARCAPADLVRVGIRRCGQRDQGRCEIGRRLAAADPGLVFAVRARVVARRR